jgi:hypothetical protein
MLRPGKKMRSIVYGNDRRMRLCGRCRSWYVGEWNHSPLCTVCQAEARETPALPWVPWHDAPGFYGKAMTVGQGAIGEPVA